MGSGIFCEEAGLLSKRAAIRFPFLLERRHRGLHVHGKKTSAAM